MQTHVGNCYPATLHALRACTQLGIRDHTTWASLRLTPHQAHPTSGSPHIRLTPQYQSLHNTYTVYTFCTLRESIPVIPLRHTASLWCEGEGESSHTQCNGDNNNYNYGIALWLQTEARMKEYTLEYTRPHICTHTVTRTKACTHDRMHGRMHAHTHIHTRTHARMPEPKIRYWLVIVSGQIRFCPAISFSRPIFCTCNVWIYSTSRKSSLLIYTRVGKKQHSTKLVPSISTEPSPRI